VPIRVIVEKLGGSVDWNNGITTLSLDGNKIVIQNGYYSLNNGSKSSIRTEIIDGRTYLPLRTILEALGMSLDYRDGVISIAKQMHVLTDAEVNDIKNKLSSKKNESQSNSPTNSANEKARKTDTTGLTAQELKWCERKIAEQELIAAGAKKAGKTGAVSKANARITAMKEAKKGNITTEYKSFKNLVFLAQRQYDGYTKDTTVKDVQDKMELLGYKFTKVNNQNDGKYGEETWNNVAYFQIVNGLDATGQLDKKTYDLIVKKWQEKKAATSENVQQPSNDEEYIDMSWLDDDVDTTYLTVLEAVELTDEEKIKVIKARKEKIEELSLYVDPNALIHGIQTGLDILGLVPVIGEPVDGLNATIYLVRGDQLNAALSAGSMVPIAGWVSTGGKLVKKSIKVAKDVDKGVSRAILKTDFVATSNGLVVKATTAEKWHKGTFSDILDSMEYHQIRHAKGRTIDKYTDDAMNFYNNNKHLGQPMTLKDGTQGIKIQTGTGNNKVGGYWTNDGKLVTFWD